MPAVQFLTPIGRLVQGDVFEAQTKDQAGAQLIVKTGPNAGQPTQRFFIAVAFAKNDPNFPAFYTLIDQVARASFPSLFPVAGGPCVNPKFAWKVMDGDGVDDNGRPNNQKEGFAGHWIVKFSSSFAPKAYHAGKYQPHEQITDKTVIRRGYFVRVAGTIEGNAQTMKPGVYVNLNMVELAGYGDEIVSGPQATEVFGGAPVQQTAMPAGFRPTPAGGTPMPGQPAVAGAPATPGAVPGGQPALPATAQPGAGPTTLQQIVPNPAFTAGPGASLPGPGALPGPAAVLPAPVVRQMTAKAGGATFEQFMASGQGWTEELLRAQGFMV